MTASGLWDLPHYAVKDDAVYTRLQDVGRDTFQSLFGQVTTVLQRQVRPVRHPLGALAAWASGVYALDGMSLDRVSKRLPSLRGRDDTPLPGQVAAVFDVRAQLWRTVTCGEDARANDKGAARGLLAGLEAGSLILADLGSNGLTT